MLYSKSGRADNHYACINQGLQNLFLTESRKPANLTGKQITIIKNHCDNDLVNTYSLTSSTKNEKTYKNANKK